MKDILLSDYILHQFNFVDFDNNYVYGQILPSIVELEKELNFSELRRDDLSKSLRSMVKENNQLKQQIEKMKCCYNCGERVTKTTCKHINCYDYDKWELKTC
jgi:hypothetical protein